ncbi:MAG TPA: ATPase, T2SS/T4P/T4SS family, partial [Vicinamibacterales bacterium]|nr:ATPase, T2SS/T4P/T4SS family [Vicinamibacterales bacterium]
MQDEDDDLDRLVSELNDWRPGGPAADPGRLDRWLAALTEREGSDLFLVAGLPPSIRVQGSIVPLVEGPLDGPDIEDAVLPALPPYAAQRYRTRGDADTSLRRAGLGRFRVNLHRERGRPAASIRALPAVPPRLGDLGLPANVERLTRLPHGLVLIGGPTGSGKTTTLAALVDHLNRRDARHIVTIEDPIE